MSSKDYKTRKKVCQALIELLAQMPYHKISVSRLVSHAQVSRTAFYNNFSTVDNVMMDIYRYSFRLIYRDRFSCPDYIASADYIRDTIVYFDRFSAFLLAVDRQEVAQYYYALIRKRIVSGIRSQDPILMRYADYCQVFYLSSVFHICMLWLQKGKRESQEELLRICLHLREKACTAFPQEAEATLP